MTDRAISSVLDVTVCLLLLSASALTLTHAPTPTDRGDPDRADTTLEILTTSTAWIEYGPASTADSNWTAHGTLAGLLAAGAVANGTRSDPDSTLATRTFQRAVTEAVLRATVHVDARVQVIARWRASPTTQVRGRFVVGPSPLPSASVSTASTTVPWGPTDDSRESSVGEVRLTVRTWSP